MTKTWSTKEIKDLLKKSDKAVMRGISAIHSLQTNQEQINRGTVEHNGVGFNSYDAEFLSSLAEFYKDKDFLSPRQIELGRKGILKYSAQLCRIANGELHV